LETFTKKGLVHKVVDFFGYVKFASHSRGGCDANFLITPKIICTSHVLNAAIFIARVPLRRRMLKFPWGMLCKR
jgi:hypothetical protein